MMSNYVFMCLILDCVGPIYLLKGLYADPRTVS